MKLNINILTASVHTYGFGERSQLLRVDPAKYVEAVGEGGDKKDVRDDKGCEDVLITADIVKGGIRVIVCGSKSWTNLGREGREGRDFKFMNILLINPPTKNWII